MSQLFSSSDQSIRASASASVLPMNIQLISFRIEWFDFLEVQGTLKSFLTPQFKSINSSVLSLLYGPTLTSIRDYRKKIIALTRWTFVSKIMSLFFNMLSRFVIAFLPRSKLKNVCYVSNRVTVILPQVHGQDFSLHFKKWDDLPSFRGST